MDFVIHPAKGFLNTYFGFKLLDFDSNKSIKFKFSDGSFTELLTENTIVYKQFSKAGKYTVVLECGDKIIEKTVIVSDSYKLGTGRTLDIIFPAVNNVILQRKTTGINIYYRDLGGSISKDILPDEILQWDESHSLFITKNRGADEYPLCRFGIFDYESAEFVEEFEGYVVKYWSEEQVLIYYQTNKICLMSHAGLTEIEGNFKVINASNSLYENCKIVYEKEGVLWQFSLRFYTSAKIGSYEFYEPTVTDNLIVLLQDHKYYIWDLYGEKMVEKGVDSYIVFENRDILIDDYNQRSLDLRLADENTSYKLTRKESFSYSLSEDGAYVIRASSDGYFLAYSKKASDSDFKFYKCKFIRSLISDLLVVELNGKETLVSLEKQKFLFAGEDKISFAFRYEDKNFVVIQGETTVTLHEYNSLLRKRISYQGVFDADEVDKLIEHNHLWIKKGPYEKVFTVYDGLSRNELKSVNVRKEFSDWIITENPSLLNSITLEETPLGYSNFYQINPETGDGVIEKADGYYLVPLTEDKVEGVKMFSADIIYTECEIHPSGKMAVLCHQGMTQFLDLNTFEKIEVPDTSFVRIDHKGNIILRNEMRRNSAPRIFDPFNFQEITYPNFNLYKFYSPDGRFKSNIGIETVRKQETVPDQFIIENGTKKAKIIEKIEKWITIIDDHSSKEYKVKVYENTKWFNFLSFAFDNKFFALAGCNTGGVLQLFQVKDGQEIEPVGVYKQRNANWRCVFSSNGKYLACYDSNPITYVYSLEAELSELGLSMVKIEDRSIECFSPDSQFIVLSQHKYQAMSTGGVGWIPSSKIFINSAETKEQLMELDEHNTQVKFANFSSDCKKLISRSSDGIVIIRNFDYDDLLKLKTDSLKLIKV